MNLHRAAIESCPICHLLIQQSKAAEGMVKNNCQSGGRARVLIPQDQGTGVGNQTSFIESRRALPEVRIILALEKSLPPTSAALKSKQSISQ